MHTLLAMLALVLGMAHAVPASAQWMWRDAAGRPVFSDRPPPPDVPEQDVAAALAIVAQGDTPLLLTEEDDRQFERDKEQLRELGIDGGVSGWPGWRAVTAADFDATGAVLDVVTLRDAPGA